MGIPFSGLLVLALVTVTFGSLTPQPARADMDEATFVDCTPNYAEWTWSDPKLNSARTAHPVASEKGTDTYIFTCRVGPHDVRVNFISQPWAAPHCGGVAYDAVSVWVDGVKVVDKREYGDMPACQSGNTTSTPYKMIINRTGRITTCNDIYADPRPPCKLETLALDARQRDPAHMGPVKRTAPALVLIDNREPALCRSLTGDANLSLRRGDDDGIYRKYAVKGVPTSADDDANLPRVRRFALDVDNDGKVDEVTGTYDIAGLQFGWRSEGTGKTAVVDLPLLGYENTDWFENRVSDFLGFVRIRGKIYLYEGDIWLISGSPEVTTSHVDAMMGAEPRFRNKPSHRLYRLTGDGKAELMCSWTPRQRPEEYM